MKNLLNKIRKFKALSVVLTAAIIFGLVVSESNVGAASYIYDYWKNIIPSSEGITYKETYYNKDIVSADDANKNLYNQNILTQTQESVSDMEVYDSKIFLLHIFKQTQLRLPTTPASDKEGYELATVGQLIVINQNFQYETIKNEFFMTSEVKAKLDKFYQFDTPIEKITEAQVTSAEFVTTKTALVEEQAVDASKVVNFDKFAYSATNEDNSLVISINGQIVPSTEYTSEIKTKKIEIETDEYDDNGNLIIKTEEVSYTQVKFNAGYGVAEGTVVKAQYEGIETPGRAPYVPYSEDPTIPVIRLNNPQGITVTDDGIYIADTDNARILKLNHNYEVIDVYLTPDDSTFYQMYNSAYETEYGTAYEKLNSSTSVWFTELSSGTLFAPQKVAVNASGVCYCISKNTYQGLVEFGANTEFNRFVGKNTVTTSALKQLWSDIWTEEQYASQALDLPSMFNNISISPDGFLYATANPDSEATQVMNLVQVINAKGNDIMKRNGYVTPDGDAVYITTTNEKNVITGPSVLTAVAISEDGNFTVCDQKRGRLFTYDSEGNLLYITGEQPGGTESGGSGNGLSHSIIAPIAVDYLYRTNDKGETEETVIVLDSYSKSIILFETTEFGKAVNKAIALYQTGKISDEVYLNENGEEVVAEGAETYWRKVIKMNTNYELAYLGIGKALNLRGEYQEAMKYFKLAHSATYYSKAFSSYRDQVLNDNFNLIMTVILVFIGGVIVKHVLKIVDEKNKKVLMKGDDE